MTAETKNSNASTDSRTGRFWRKLSLAVLALAVLFLLISTVVFVDETEYVTVERLGNIVAVYDADADRGLHFKLPWPIDTTRRFDRRVQLFDPPGREVFTRDKKNVTVDAYICWRIAEPESSASSDIASRPVVRFFRSLGSPEIAESRLDSRVRSIVSTAVGQVDLSTLLNVENSEVGPEAGEPSLIEQISETVREQVAKRPGETQSLRDRLGIEIVDVRVKRINFPLGNQQAVFERMKSERRKIADRYRSAGMAQNTVIKSQADRQYNEILARADADAERIRGDAEAESISILNRAHAEDPEFYRVTQALDAYRKILNERTTLVLSASSNLLKLLTEGIPELSDESAPTSQPQAVDANPVLLPAAKNSEDDPESNDDDDDFLPIDRSAGGGP